MQHRRVIIRGRDQKKFYGGDYTGYAQGLGKNIVDTVGNLASSLGKALAGDLSSIVDSIGKLGLGNMAEKSMPNMLSIRSMLSGEPVGEWHLTVGNPLNPIAVIGNLIMTDATISFGETLGVDDFPTEVKFEVKLKPGKPRDKGDIESMFNNGYGRMTYAPMTALPSSKNTFEKGNSADELYAKLSGQASGNDNWSNDNAVKTIQTRVRQQWGHTFGDSANLLFMINSTKSRF